jgi:thiol:disulfide interchange protein
MHIFRLAYTAQFLLALIAIFLLWSEVGGQSHLDLMPWYIKLGLGAGAAFTAVKATAAAVAGESAWNIKTLRWLGLTLLLLVGCALASYYVHVNEENDDDQDDQTNSAVSRLVQQPTRQMLL